MWPGGRRGTGVTGRFTGIRGARFTGILTTDTTITGIITTMPTTAIGIITGTRGIKITTIPVSGLILQGLL
jgi:hypothetical protein